MANPLTVRRGLLAAALLAGCAGNKVLPPSGNTAYGVYHFLEVVATAHPPVTLEGDVALLPDTITVSLKDSPCTPSNTNRTSISTISYTCGDYRFSFNRQNPLRENSYFVPTVQYDNQRICLMTGIVNGREVCTRYGNERIERRTSMSGRIRFVAK